jgi:predicted DCC family thiol-disulfide oxidoreductase YuxK
LLVYDGDCGFCTRSASWIARRLPPTCRAQPWQALDLASVGLSEADVTTAAYWIEPDGRRRRGSEAVAAALVAAGGAWRPLGVLLGVPPLSWLARAVYRLIADNRHRLPGSTEACRVPGAKAAGARRRSGSTLRRRR